MASNVVQKGEKKPSRYYYLAWLGGILIANASMIMKFYKKIEWWVVLPFLWMAVITSYLWQTLHNYYPGDIDRGVSGWMFYSGNLLTTKLFMGGVIEDILIFHPFGLLFGALLALYVFKIFNEKETINSRKNIIAISAIVIILLWSSIMLDISSRLSFALFALPGVLVMKYSIGYINLKRFLLWYVAMIAFTFTWDYTSVVLMAHLYGDGGRSWFYIKDGLHSMVYNANAFMFGELPISIDFIYPGSGMVFLIGITGYIKHKNGKRKAY